jgi:hypothetical protein
MGIGCNLRATAKPAKSLRCAPPGDAQDRAPLVRDSASGITQGHPTTSRRNRIKAANYSMNSRFTPQIVKIATIGIFIVFALCIYPVSRAHPWSDDWTYPGIYGSNWKEFLQWVVAQHVDHRIPIIKLVQYGLLKLSRFDFRVLLLFNAAMATAGALALVGAARLHRGSAHWGDLVIPLTVLNFGFGLYAWAFSAQFSFCIALSFVFLFLFIKSQSANSKPLLIAAMVALLACALCGMNGAIVATVISAAILVLAIRQRAWKTQRAMVAGPALVLAMTAAVFLTWQPSGTTLAAQSDPATRMLSWARHLVESSFIVDGWLQGYSRPILCGSALWRGAGARTGLPGAGPAPR